MIDLHFEGARAHEASAALTERLPEAEFNIPGYIVADVSVDAQDQGRDAAGVPWALLRLSALLVEDW
jgi:hypothetical protein